MTLSPKPSPQGEQANDQVKGVPDSAPVHPSAVPVVAPFRILLVEKDDDLRQLLGEVYVVQVAIDGEAVLAAARSYPPDLILADVMMPRMDAFGLLRELRADSGLREIPMIFLSEAGSQDLHVEAMESGADDYLTKPFTARELLARVGARLKRARVRREASESLRVHPDDVTLSRQALDEATGHRDLTGLENRYIHKDGTTRWISWHTSLEGDTVYAYGRNITVQKQQAGALQEAEALLRQSQKMEAVGHLTGGVAHDFNNILQVISGNLQLAARYGAGNDKVEQCVSSAQAAVTRGAKLSNQLLAFSRRQALEPKVINVGRFVRGMDEMLRRSLGEGVEIDTSVSGGLWNAFVDPTQIENALLNLALNARDAMDATGKLTIEVGNAFLDDAYAHHHAEVSAGQYVVVAVSDSGSGMPPEVMAQVFEPFFSTKPAGKGTGLGLSMVYGFVKQSGGHIKIYSELGHGTTVKLYLPRAHQSEDVIALTDMGPVAGGTETVLVAEDDQAVRDTVLEMLSELGYRVLKANDAAAALAIVDSGVSIDLLFTDVVMPGTLKSPELARKVRQRLPNVAVLFTSGYTENAIVHGGRLDAGVDLLPKPYTREALALKVRQVLSNTASVRRN